MENCPNLDSKNRFSFLNTLAEIVFSVQNLIVVVDYSQEGENRGVLEQASRLTVVPAYKDKQILKSDFIMKNLVLTYSIG
jgi:hypothetical protein